MSYEDFIYKLIKLMMDWGVWKDSVRICCGDREYAPCQMPKHNSEKPFDMDDYYRRSIIFNTDKENNLFRDLENVVVISMTKENKLFKEKWPNGAEIYIEINGELSDLFEFGCYTTYLNEISLQKRTEAYYSRDELRESFREEYNLEDIKKEPEEFGFPSALEFDSADEYDAFIEEEIHNAEMKFIKDLSGKITYDNDLEAEICCLCIDNNLSYLYDGYDLYIGKGFF